MSVYQWVVGRVIFSSEEILDEFLDKYTPILTDDERFISEVGGFVSTPEGKTDVSRDLLTVQIPLNCYRNFSPMFEDILEEAYDYGFLWFYDSELTSGCQTPTQEKIFRRQGWVSNLNCEKEPERSEYEVFEYWAEAHNMWISDVRHAFFRRYKEKIPPVLSRQQMGRLKRTRQTAIDDFETLPPGEGSPIIPRRDTSPGKSRRREYRGSQASLEKFGYYDAYCEMIQSHGCDGSLRLLSAGLSDRDSQVVGMVDEVITSFEEKTTHPDSESDVSSSDTSPQTIVPSALGNKRYSKSSVPAILGRYLQYHRERALTAGDCDSRTNLEGFANHATVFWEAIELCLLLEQCDDLGLKKAQRTQLLDVCKEEVIAWFTQLEPTLRLLNTALESNGWVPANETPAGEAGSEASISETWQSVFEILFVHPGIVLELEMGSPLTIFDSKMDFAGQMMTTFEEINPDIGKFLVNGTKLTESTAVILQNLRERAPTAQHESPLSGSGIQAIVLYLLSKKLLRSESFVDRLTNSTQLSTEEITSAAQFALRGDEAIVKCGLMTSLQWAVVFEEPRRTLEQLSSRY